MEYTCYCNMDVIKFYQVKTLDLKASKVKNNDHPTFIETPKFNILSR